MKTVLYLSFVLFLLKCGGPDLPKFKILTGNKSNQFTWGDSLDLKLNKTFEGANVRFFLNNQPIEEKHLLTNEQPMGTHPLKAIVSAGEQTYEVESTLTVLAPFPPKLYTFELIATYPHDITAYTQGLEFDGEILYESTGLYEKSSLRTVNYENCEILVNKPLDANFFGEGLTVFEDKIIQLTWKAKKGFIYDKATLVMQKSFEYKDSKEGWGLCNDGNFLFKTDGTNQIWTLDPETMAERGNIQVMTNKAPIKNLNELEWVDGKIYANTYQFQKDVVVIIDPKNGIVEGVVDFSGLKNQVTQHPQLNVFNGIAYHPDRKTFFVTGKNWDKLFEVKIFLKE